MRKLFLLLFASVFLLASMANAAAAASTEAVRVEVIAYVDTNGDKLMSDGEGIDNIPVYVDVDGQRQVKIMERGKLIFSLPYANVERLKVEIPYLAVAEEIKPKDNQAQVIFRLKSPELPVYLP